MLLEQCQKCKCAEHYLTISLAQAYWALFDSVYTSIIQNPDKNINYIVDSIPDEVFRCVYGF